MNELSYSFRCLLNSGLYLLDDYGVFSQGTVDGMVRVDIECFGRCGVVFRIRPLDLTNLCCEGCILLCFTSVSADYGEVVELDGEVEDELKTGVTLITMFAGVISELVGTGHDYFLRLSGGTVGSLILVGG